MKNDLTITKEEICQLLEYNPVTGIFLWLTPTGNSTIGSVAGCIKPDGYIRIQIRGRLYYAHRLAWLVFYGDWPASIVDHIDGNRGNNSISNLRNASLTENNRNRKRASTKCKKGVKKNGNRWQARIRAGEKQVHLGTFKTEDEAHDAYCIAAKKLHGKFWKAE